MTSKQDLLRERIVTFFLKHENVPKIFTVNHLKAEGVPRSTVFRIISNYEHRLSIQRAPGSGTTLKAMTKQKVRKLYRQVNHSDKYTYSSAARKFNVCPKTIKRWLEKKNIRKYKKKKSPKYTEIQ